MSLTTQEGSRSRVTGDLADRNTRSDRDGGTLSRFRCFRQRIQTLRGRMKLKTKIKRSTRLGDHGN